MEGSVETYATPGGGLSVTPRLTAILAVARREAEVMNHGAVNPAHVLLAIMWDDDSVAASVIRDTGAAGPIREGLTEALKTRAGAGEADGTSVDGLLVAAARFAAGRGASHVGTEDVLGVLLEREDTVVSSVFEDLGVRSALATGLRRYFDRLSV